MWCAYDYIVNFGNAQLVIRLNDNTTALQLRWVQYNASESPAWLIDEIYVDCVPFTTVLTFEEPNRLENTIRLIIWIVFHRALFNNFWECHSGYVEKNNSDCLISPTASHLLMSGNEREARTRVFNISSNGISTINDNNDPVSSCRGMCLIKIAVYS